MTRGIRAARVSAAAAGSCTAPPSNTAPTIATPSEAPIWRRNVTDDVATPRSAYAARVLGCQHHDLHDQSDAQSNDDHQARDRERLVGLSSRARRASPPRRSRSRPAEGLVASGSGDQPPGAHCANQDAGQQRGEHQAGADRGQAGDHLQERRQVGDHAEQCESDQEAHRHREWQSLDRERAAAARSGSAATRALSSQASSRRLPTRRRSDFESAEQDDADDRCGEAQRPEVVDRQPIRRARQPQGEPHDHAAASTPSGR